MIQGVCRLPIPTQEWIPRSMNNVEKYAMISSVRLLRHLWYLGTIDTKSTWLLLRGTIVNRTYGRHKNQDMYYVAISSNCILSYLLWPPGIRVAGTQSVAVLPLF